MSIKIIKRYRDVVVVLQYAITFVKKPLPPTMYLLTYCIFRKLTLCALLLFFCLALRAQSHCVIVDKETGTPIRNVNIHADNGQTMVTDYRGVAEIEGTFKSATISHASYLTRYVERAELRDTIWLLPRENRLSEVVVWGNKQQQIQAVVKSATEDLASYAPPNSGIPFDFAELIRKKPLSRKARKKNKELLKNWDELYTNSDPTKEGSNGSDGK